MSDFNTPRYYVAPGEGGKMYVLRVKGYKQYRSGRYPYDHLVKVLGTDLEEAKRKAEEHLGNSNFEVNSAPLKEITRKAKDPDKEWKWQFGQYKDQDIRYMDWENQRVQSYSTWFWNANRLQRKEKDEDFFQKIQAILLERGLIKEYKGELLTKKDYDWKVKQDQWKEEQKKAAEKSDFVGNKGDKIRRSIKFIFVTTAGETRYGTFYVSKFVDEEGNSFSLKGAYPPFTDKENFHDCVFTIKDYNEFRGEKQTVISRIKVLDLPKTEEPEPEEPETNRGDDYFDPEMEARAAANESFYPTLI